MNRKVVLLNILLLLLLVWLGMRLRTSWLESKAREQAALARAAKPGQVVPPPGVPEVDPASPADYIDVAQRMLFSKDRDPNVLVDPPAPPPAPPPDKPVPPLPSYYGQMSLGEPVIVLGNEKLPQKSYHAGEKIGEFKIASWDRDTVTLEWEEKTLVNNLRDLTPKEAERPSQAAAPVPTAAAQTAKSITKMGGAAPKSDPAFGPPNGMYRACVASDTSPHGTVKDGYQKAVVPGLMGVTCQWEPIR
jgi:Sec-independent protein translocase protein TatA